jgi:hypothetical protein
MSHETQVDHSLCAASQCEMIASMTKSTNGEGEWLCFIHSAAEKRDWPLITQELVRLDWIVQLVKSLRMAGRRQNFDEVREQARQGSAMAQRGDLNMSDTESMLSYMIRLESMLQASAREACK